MNPRWMDLDTIPVPKEDTRPFGTRLWDFLSQGGPWGTAQPGQRGTFVPSRINEQGQPELAVPGIVQQPAESLYSLMTSPLSDLSRMQDPDITRTLAEQSFDVAGMLPAAGVAATKAAPKTMGQRAMVAASNPDDRTAKGLKTREIGVNPNHGALTDVMHPEGGSLGVFTSDKLSDVLSNPSKYVPTKGEDLVRAGHEQALRDAGIPGIRYLDQGSRSAGEGSRNYVVFDDALVEILRKYANAPDPTTAAILALLTQQQQGAPPQQ